MPILAGLHIAHIQGLADPHIEECRSIRFALALAKCFLTLPVQSPERIIARLGFITDDYTAIPWGYYEMVIQ